MARVGVLQIDSVNVLVRSHYLPLFSRLGPYPMDLLDQAAYRAPRELFEYWGHAASLMPVATQPLLRWRMARAEAEAWRFMRKFQEERPGYVETVLDTVRQRGPIGASEFEAERPRRSGNWWGWHDAKRALEWLFWAGRITTSGRRGFERLYDLPERVLPAAVISAPTPAAEDAQRELVRIAGRSLGVATERSLRDYFRLSVAEARARVRELVDVGELHTVRVEGWKSVAYLDPAIKLLPRVEPRALLSPFDSLVWDRGRSKELFGMEVTLEIYVPAEKRVHGYYVLPFLRGDSLAARVDLKADRRARVLRVLGAWAHDGHDLRSVAADLIEELRDLASWLGLNEVDVVDRGDLAPELRRAVVAEAQSQGISSVRAGSGISRP
jgi:uncharacterized protein